jgi:hypothetical protein
VGGSGSAESRLITAARRWVQDCYPYNSQHLIETLTWLDRISPGSREAVRLAALTHDMERAFPGADSPVMTGLGDAAYHAAHSARSASIVGAWLRENGAEDALVRDVEALIRVHEDGGWPEADAVQAADSLSFLATNVDLFLGFVRAGRFGVRDVRWKFEYSYQRIQIPDAKALARPLLEAALARLDDLERSTSPLARATETQGSAE